MDQRTPTKHQARRHRRTTLRDGPDPIDVHVGARIRLRRMLMGLSQSELGAAVGVTFQQIQKYEQGTNRISASMLHHLGQALDVPVSFFFNDLPENLKGASSPRHADPFGRDESIELLRGYYSTPEQVRKRIYDLVKALEQENKSARNGSPPADADQCPHRKRSR
ncbi:helix-turn-helix domain-containing protein [Azospirillum agricola]|uniref:helix-turn-helix domain-containing protein n=1 Tax=Azospirillum agricola TaxID=1720247 RepID=UPI000A0F3A35|nr:helix-turn-helix transcriptional regulator [Azospirillum agricola]SMH43256.1 Transcriptional regulator, contains XRE-family HTH domain [Azospirillum lipoferum]